MSPFHLSTVLRFKIGFATFRRKKKIIVKKKNGKKGRGGMKGVYMLNTTYMYGMYSYLVRTQKTRINIGCVMMMMMIHGNGWEKWRIEIVNRGNGIDGPFFKFFLFYIFYNLYFFFFFSFPTRCAFTTIFFTATRIPMDGANQPNPVGIECTQFSLFLFFRPIFILFL